MADVSRARGGVSGVVGVAVAVVAAFGVAVPPLAAAVSGSDGVVEAFERTPLFTAEHGVTAPVGVTYVDGPGLVAAAEPMAGGSSVVLVSPVRDAVAGRMTVPGLSDPVTLADDGHGLLAGLAADSFVTWPAAARGEASVRRRPVVGVPVLDAQGMAYDAVGQRWLVLDAVQGRILVLDARGETVRASEGVSLSGLDAGSLRGIAVEASTGRVFVGAPEQERIYEVTGEGEPGRVLDVADVELAALSGLAFGPTADPTDERSSESLYVADSGDGSTLGRVSEVSLTALGEGAVAAATTSTATLVRRTFLSELSPPSPDPAGIVYMSDVDRLLVADSEVEEMTIYQGVNLWQLSRNGSTLHDTGNTRAYSNEPTGVGYDPVGKRMFISDDGRRRIFEVTRGPDNRFGTADDPVTWFSTTAFGDDDPEDVTYDTRSGDLFVTDGVGLDVIRVSPGPNGRFDGVAPTGDDVATRFDMGRYGITDLEGVGYSTARDSLFLADRKYTQILEVTKDGALVQSIDVAGIGMRNPAGITLAPASNDPTRTSMYVVTRGIDNDNDPNENDGMMFELSAPNLGDPGSQTNRAPVVDAGADSSVVLPGSASLDGTVSDDGLPNPPGVVSTTWSRVSGPGTVTFGNASAVDTTASFSVAGTYVLRLSASDGALSSSDDVVVTVLPSGGGGAVQTVETRVATGSDDAEQRGSSSTDLSSSDLELVVDGSTQQVVGTRFAGLQVPQGASVTSAWVQFRTDEVSTGVSSLTIRAEAADNAPTYQAVAGNLTSRATTSASVAWSPPAWNTVGEAAAAQRTPGLAALVQAVVSRPGWAPGNALAMQFSGAGTRTAEAFEGGASFAPLLHVEYTTGGGGTPTNQAPVVDAGADSSVVLPGSASLDGTVSDDGLPNPPGVVSTTWSRVSGPGTVTFGNASAVDTTASFSVAGTYVLRLSASDGALSSSDDVVVTVSAVTPTNQAPVVDAGADSSVVLPGSASLDGTVSDDGLPNPPGVVSTTWSRVSGPGTVTFGNASAVDTTASFSVAGTYVLRLSASDGALSASDEVTVTVQSDPTLRGVDIQTVNGTGTAGLPDNGDSITLTFSRQIDLASVTPGWTGSALSVQVRFQDGVAQGFGAKGDTVDVLRAGQAVNLGSIRLNEDYIANKKTAVFNATMTSGTTVVGGESATVITLRLGTLATGDGLRAAKSNSSMVWTPSALATDLNGNAVLATPVTESGAADREF